MEQDIMPAAGRGKTQPFFVRLWMARDELSLRNIEKGHIAYLLIFPLGIILSDVLYHDWDVKILGMDSIMFQTIAYGLAWLVCTFLPKNILPIVMRAAMIGAMILVVPAAVLSGASEGSQTELLLVAAFQFCVGIFTACGFFVFSYILNNAERWIGVLIIGIYYGAAWALYHVEAVERFNLTVLPVLLSVVAVVAVFKIKPQTLRDVDVITAKPKPKNRRLPFSWYNYPKMDAGGGRDEIKDTDSGAHTQEGLYFVLILYAVYYFVNLTNYFLEADQDYLDDTFYGLGMLGGVLIAVLIQLLFNRSVWHLWNTFLIITVIGLLIIISGLILNSQSGSFIYGIADNVGYMAVLYLLGCVAKMSKAYLFFRLSCLIMFAHDVIISPIMDEVFLHNSGSAYIIAASIIMICVGACIALAPLLERKVFSMDWMDGLHAVDVLWYLEQFELGKSEQQAERFNLTQAEAAVAKLLIEGETPHTISRRLHLSAAEVDTRLGSIREKVVRGSDSDAGIAIAIDRYKLTRREADVLRCLCRQMTNTQIAEEFVLSDETVKTHLRKLMKKLPLENRKDAAQWVKDLEESGYS